ncbi:MAG: hypothetical protein AB1546_05100, partial [bacterium]
QAPASYPGIPTDPVPGARITYRLNYTNYGEAAETNTILIEDVIPTNAAYSTGSLIFNGTPKTDATDGDECQYESGAEKVICAPQNVAAGATGQVEFKIVIE